MNAAVLDLTARKTPAEQTKCDAEALERLVRERTIELERRNAERTHIIACLESTRGEFERLTREDPLSGLANRRAFDSRLALDHQRAVRLRLPLSPGMVDVDHFKRINATFGHENPDSTRTHRGSRPLPVPGQDAGRKRVMARSTG